MKLGYHKHSKVTEPYFFRKMSFAQKKGPKWPKMDCFDNFSKCSKSESHIFSDILHEVKGT